MNLITTPAQVGYTPAATAIVHSTTASLTSRAPVQPVHLVQYDQTMPVIAVALTANGQPYTVPSGAAVNVRMDKPDGTHVYDPALGVSTDGQTAYIGITAQMTAAAGSSSPIVEIVVNEGVAGTAAFSVIIDPNPVPDSAYESTDEYLTLYGILQQAQSAAQVVQQYGGVLTTISDNIDTVLAVPAAAQSAAASATAAQQAAQEALGFRTFFSAVTPDENGDLDPSRPMTTPTAASVTVKSKGDRIQSVEVNGFTTQAGTGDPSPANVREIGAAGLRMAAIVYDGSSDEAWTWDNGFAYIRLSFSVSNSLQSAVGSIYCNRLATASTLSIQTGSATNAIGVVQSPIGVGTIFIRFSQANSIDSFKQNLQQNPVLVYVEPADESQATGLYIPIQAQGHEYRCQCLELTAPLCDGDKVESYVPSGCDVKLVFDGSSDENWSQNESSGSKRFVIAVSNIPITDQKSGRGFSNLLYLAPTGGTGVTGNSFCFTVGSDGNLYVKTDGKQTLEQFRESLTEKNLVFYFRSTAYTEQNDIPVQLETHSFGVYAMTGAEDIKREKSSAGRVYFGLASKNAANQSTSIICSQAKGGPSITEGNIQIASNIVYVWFSGYGLDKTVDEIKEYIAAQHSAGTPVTIVYKLATPAIYARDPVTLVAVPFTEADETAANQLASTPSTLPYIDSADVPMLLNSADNTDSAAQVMALAANAVPVAGTYVVSSQDGTTVTVSLKAMQDGGDAATVGGQIVQAGSIAIGQINASSENGFTINLAVPMPGDYAVSFAMYQGGNYWPYLRIICTAKTSTSFNVVVRNENSSGASGAFTLDWIAVGYKS